MVTIVDGGMRGSVRGQRGDRRGKLGRVRAGRSAAAEGMKRPARMSMTVATEEGETGRD